MVKLWYYLKQNKLRIVVSVIFLVVAVFDLFMLGFNVVSYINATNNVTKVPQGLTILNIICAVVNILFVIFFLSCLIISRTKTLRSINNENK